MEKIYLDTRRITKPVEGVGHIDFCEHYKGQSQMHVNKINGSNLSGRAYEILAYIHGCLNEDDEPEMNKQAKGKVKKK